MRKSISFYIVALAILLCYLCLYHFNRQDGWSSHFREVEIISTHDEEVQYAYFHSAKSETSSPLIVSLHTWSGDYRQHDPIAAMVAQRGWNYIHPDFRGANDKPIACLSDAAISDLDDAIGYAIENAPVDMDKIYVVGLSGGAYTALGFYLKSKYPLRRTIAWCAISDLEEWYYQSLARRDGYSDSIFRCTSNNGSLDIEAMRMRSPLHWEFPESPNGVLDLYAGMNDGFEGSVPISHSINFYNAAVSKYGERDAAVEDEQFLTLVTRALDYNQNLGQISGRRVVYHRESGSVRLTLFDGAHEMLGEYAVQVIEESL